VRALAPIAILAGAGCFAGGAQAQLPVSFSSPCPERKTIGNWCPPQLSKEGWTLKYESASPPDLMDAYWRYEVWIRERSAVLCELSGGRGGIKTNFCKELSEVNR
jgi:hypothetical protein